MIFSWCGREPSPSTRERLTSQTSLERDGQVQRGTPQPTLKQELSMYMYNLTVKFVLHMYRTIGLIAAGRRAGAGCAPRRMSLRAPET